MHKPKGSNYQLYFYPYGTSIARKIEHWSFSESLSRPLKIPDKGG